MLPDHRYLASSDGWIFLCREDLVLGIDPLAEGLVGLLWPLVRDGAPTASVLDELTRGGISSAPGFLLLEAAAGIWRVLARGAGRVEFPGLDIDAVDGSTASAWSESLAPSGAVLRCVTPGAPGATTPWAVRVGIVRASEFVLGDENVPTAGSDDLDAGPTAPVIEAPKSSRSRVIPRPPGSPSPGEDPGLGITISSLETTAIEPLESALDEAAPGSGTEHADYDHLFGETVTRSVEGAAVRGAEDHDGGSPLEDRTKVATDLAERRALRRAAKAAGASEAPPAGPRFTLDLSTGGREPLEGVVIVGRAPSANRVAGGEVPRLLTMSTPNQDISRTHVQIALAGGTVVVTDLHSSNGTFVVLPGQPPQRLRAGESKTVVVGTVIDLGDGATLTLREES